MKTTSFTPVTLHDAEGTCVPCNPRVVAQLLSNGYTRPDTAHEAHDDLVSLTHVGDVRATRLIEAGITTFKGVAVTDADIIADIIEVSADAAREIIIEAAQVAGDKE